MCADDRQHYMRKRCWLLSVNRSSVYFEPRQETAESLLCMRLIDKHSTADRAVGCHA